MDRPGTCKFVEELVAVLPDHLQDFERRNLAIKFSRIWKKYNPITYRCRICGGVVRFDGTNPQKPKSNDS